MRTLESNGKLRHLKAKPIIIFYRECALDFDLFYYKLNFCISFRFERNSIDKIAEPLILRKPLNILFLFYIRNIVLKLANLAFFILKIYGMQRHAF